MLLTETRFHRDPLAALGAAARDYGLAALCLHTSTKSVRLRAMTPVGLKCALGHETSLLLVRSVALRQEKSINEAKEVGKPGPPENRAPGATFFRDWRKES